MAYATRTDIEAIYGAAHLETLVAADLDLDAAVDRACAAASAEIDAYLGQRYAVPLTPPSDVVTSWCVDIACWRLAANIAQLSEEVRKRAERALAILKDVAAGRASVPGLTATATGDGGSDLSVGSSAGPAFSSRRRVWGGEGGSL